MPLLNVPAFILPTPSAAVAALIQYHDGIWLNASHISETVASNVGISYLMMSASATFRVPLVFAALLVIAAMGIVMYAVAAFFENHFTGWATRGDINGAAR